MSQISFSVAHKRYVSSLYRRALKTSLDWCVDREAWRRKAIEIRARFDANKNVNSIKHLRALLEDAENELEKYRHPDPYRYPTAPGGTKWERHIPPTPHVTIQ
ncbi:21570_t:CDS:2, partial [Racocetra persica]